MIAVVGNLHPIMRIGSSKCEVVSRRLLDVHRWMTPADYKLALLS